MHLSERIPFLAFFQQGARVNFLYYADHWLNGVHTVVLCLSPSAPLGLWGVLTLTDKTGRSRYCPVPPALQRPSNCQFQFLTVAQSLSPQPELCLRFKPRHGAKDYLLVPEVERTP